MSGRSSPIPCIYTCFVLGRLETVTLESFFIDKRRSIRRRASRRLTGRWWRFIRFQSVHVAPTDLCMSLINAVRYLNAEKHRSKVTNDTIWNVLAPNVHDRPGWFRFFHTHNLYLCYCITFINLLPREGAATRWQVISHQEWVSKCVPRKPCSKQQKLCHSDKNSTMQYGIKKTAEWAHQLKRINLLFRWDLKWPGGSRQISTMV